MPPSGKTLGLCRSRREPSQVVLIPLRGMGDQKPTKSKVDTPPTSSSSSSSSSPSPSPSPELSKLPLAEIQNSLRSRIPVSKNWLEKGLSRDPLPRSLDTPPAKPPSAPRSCLKRQDADAASKSRSRSSRGSVRFVLQPTIHLIESRRESQDAAGAGSVTDPHPPMCEKEPLTDVVQETCEEEKGGGEELRTGMDGLELGEGGDGEGG